MGRGSIPRRLKGLAALAALALAAASLPGGVTRAQQTPPAPVAAQPPLTFTSSGDSGFDAWRANFAARAIAAGRKRETVFALLEGLTPEPRSLDADQNQAEFVRPPWEYVQGATSARRINDGIAAKAANAALFSAVQ